jgi:hypothetical protein
MHRTQGFKQSSGKRLVGCSGEVKFLSVLLSALCHTLRKPLGPVAHAKRVLQLEFDGMTPNAPRHPTICDAEGAPPFHPELRRAGLEGGSWISPNRPQQTASERNEHGDTAQRLDNGTYPKLAGRPSWRECLLCKSKEPLESRRERNCSVGRGSRNAVRFAGFSDCQADSQDCAICT